VVDQRIPDDESVGTLITRVIADGRAYAAAELAYWRTFALDRLSDGVSAAIFGGAALVLSLAAIIALLVGLIMTLAPLVGPGFATLIVVVVTCGIAGVLALLALKHVRRLSRPRGEP
jgi:hypothetical protein